MRRHVWIGCFALAWVAACDRPGSEAAHGTVASSEPWVTPTDTVKPKPRSDDQGTIGRRLYDEKLQSIPEVQKATYRHVRMYQEGRVSHDVAMARLRAWLELWVREHPNAEALAAQASKLPDFVTMDTAAKARRPPKPAEATSR